MNLHIGLDIIGNFGATVSEMYGRISRIDGNLIDVKWSNGSLHYITAEDIRDDYCDSNLIGFYITHFK